MVFEKFKSTYNAVKEIRAMKRGNDSGMVGVKEIIGLVIVCLVIAYVLPTGLQALAVINTTGMSAGEVSLLGAFGIIIVIVIFSKLTE